MRIALLSYEYPPDTGYGGIGTYTWYQARALVRRGHQVRVVAGSVSPGVSHHEHDGVQVTRVLDDGPLHGAVVGLNEQGLGWAPNRLRTANGAYRVLRDLLEREQYDLVEYPECGADGMIVSTLLPVRTCVRFHSPAALIMPTYGASEADVEVTTFLEQIAIDRAEVAIAPSEFMAAAAVDRLGVGGPVPVVRNGIDLDLFDRHATTTVLVSGRLERRKGAHLLTEILAPVLRTHPSVHLAIVGADPEGLVEAELRPAIDQQGAANRLHVLGARSQREVRALVRWADIHLLPTIWDNAPYACIESMAAGGAVLSSRVGGMPELIDDRRSGLLAPPGDAPSMREALVELIEDPELRARLGAAARRTVEQHHTDGAMAERTLDVWRRHLAEPPTGS